MGTRCITLLLDEEGSEICVMYRHWDGDPASHGKELAFCIKTVNYNDLNCLAAQIIAFFKNEDEAGNIYIYGAGSRNFDEDFVYTVYRDEVSENVYIRCTKGFGKKECIFDGTPTEFSTFLEKGED